MVLTIILLAVIVLPMLSLFWGHDSREIVRSKEQELGSYGMRWPDTMTDEQELAKELAVALQRQHVRQTNRTARAAQLEGNSEQDWLNLESFPSCKACHYDTKLDERNRLERSA